MFTVYNVGMIYFDICSKKGTKRALIPDGRDGDAATKTPPHFASLFVAEDKVDLAQTNWWWGGKFEREVVFRDEHGKHETVKIFEFRINAPCDLTFPERRNGQAATIAHQDKMPRFVPDITLAENPRTIARVNIRGGTLEPRSLMGVPVVSWSVEHHADPVRISARDDDGNLYSITLKNDKTLRHNNVHGVDNIEMVLANTPDFSIVHDGARSHETSAPHETGRPHDADHDVIFRRLATNDHLSLVRPPTETLVPITLTRGYLDHLAANPRYRQGHCTPTCCEENKGGG